MAKSKNRENPTPLNGNSDFKQHIEQHKNYYIFTTSTGLKVRIYPVPQVLLNAQRNIIKKRYLEEGKPIEPPIYEYGDTSSGSVAIKKELTNEIIESRKGREPEEKIIEMQNQLLEHQQCLEEFEKEVSTQMEKTAKVRAMASTRTRPDVGIDLTQHYSDWILDMEEAGVEFEDKTDAIFQYIQDQVLISVQDDLIFGYSLNSLGSRELMPDISYEAGVEAIRESFQSHLEGQADTIRAKTMAQMDKAFTNITTSQ